jgi:hypothetical protein
MPTSAPKQKQLQQEVAASLGRSGAATHGPAPPAHPILHLQRTIGNQAVGRLLQAKLDDHQTHPRIDKATGLRLQTKLKVNELGDIYEQGAERVTNQVMGAPGHSSVSGAPPRIQRVSGQPNGQVDAVPASVDQVLGSPGRPLEPMLRQDMEQRFGHDFSQVRVHTGAAAEQSAREVNSDAYTVGHDVVFGAGRFAPAAREGRHLLAHELTHVMQQ